MNEKNPIVKFYGGCAHGNTREWNMRSHKRKARETLSNAATSVAFPRYWQL
jgi:hypothetical protein